MAQLFIQKSGHFGHRGRPGKVGGSIPDKGSSSVDMSALKQISNVNKATDHGIFGRGSFIYNGKLYDSKLHHEQIIHELGFRKGYPGVSDFLRKGGIRVRSIDNKSLYIQGEFDTSSRKSFISDIQEYADEGLFGDIYSYKTVVIDNNFLDPEREVKRLKIETNGTDFMNNDFRLIVNEKLFLFGKGFHGHKGRKGMVGGSVPRGTSGESGNEFIQVDLFSGNPLPDPSPEDADIISKTVYAVKRSVPGIQEVPISVQRVIIGETMGSSTSIKRGELKGTKVIAVSPQKIDEAIAKNGDHMKSWMNIQDNITHKNVLRHIVAHEYGHVAMESLGLEESWKQVSNGRYFSGYSQYYRNYEESFADTFANYVNGGDLPIDIEEWMLENF